MKNLLFVLIFILYTQTSKSQSLDYGNDLAAIKICNAIQGNNFASEKAADSALEQILSVVGASKRFVLQECSNINNAVALTFNGVRYIMYDPEFMSGLRYSNDWSNMFVLAHEVGHHINGHTVDALVVSGKSQVPLYTKRTQELESDEFAGFVLGRLGANLNQALSAVNNTSDADDSYSTHPRRSKRIAAVKKGFNESGGKVNSSNLGVSKGKTVDSPYSNSRYSNVTFYTLNDYFSDGVYTGYVSNNSDDPFGYGTFRSEDGYVYEGEWSGGKQNGYGKSKWANGNSYQGEYVKGSRNGKGVFTYASGVKEIGTFANGQLSGIDCKTIFDTHILEGRFMNGSIIKTTYTSKEDGSSIEIGFSNSGNGLTTYSDNSASWTGRFSNGRVVGKPIKQYKGKGYRKYARQMGLDYFIPEFVFRDLGIEFGKNAPKIGYLERKNRSSISKGYFKHSFWSPKRAGFIEQTLTKEFIENSENWLDESVKYDKFQGMYWNDVYNGYGIKFYKGKVVEKGIYKNGKFIKYEDFDLNLMLETYKDFY